MRRRSITPGAQKEASVYIYLSDIESWTVTHPEALARLPEGCHYTTAGSSGAWYERDDGDAAPLSSDW